MKTPKETVRQIREQHQINGGSLTTNQLAKLTGLTPRMVRYIARGERHRNNGVTSLAKRIIHFLNPSLTVDQVARLLNCTEEDLLSYLEGLQCHN